MNPETSTILVVDDNPMTARWVGRMIESLGYGAVLEFDGEGALNRLAEGQFVAVISDVEMPRMNGFELVQNIHLRCPEMPVVLMAASSGADCVESARAWGAWALLEKPVNSDQLAGLVGMAKRPLQTIKGLHLLATPQEASSGLS